MILKDGESPKTPFLGLVSPKTVKRILLVTLGAHWVDSRESSLLRRLERGREIGL